MPYLILAIGILIGLFALYRFFINANIAQIKALFLSLIALAVAVAVFFLAITGRLPAAIGLVVALIPFILAYLKNRMAQRKNGTAQSQETDVSTVEEALEILGLEPGASAEEITSAYKKLMKKVHPDQEGSEWMATKLNQAKDLLLKDQ